MLISSTGRTDFEDFPLAPSLKIDPRTAGIYNCMNFIQHFIYKMMVMLDNVVLSGGQKNSKSNSASEIFYLYFAFHNYKYIQSCLFNQNCHAKHIRPFLSYPHLTTSKT